MELIEALALERDIDRLAIGQTWECWSDLKKAIVDEGIRSERVLVTKKKDKLRWKVVCKMNRPQFLPNVRCGWEFRASLLSSTETITVTVSNRIHSCEASSHYTRRMHCNSSRVADKLVDIVVKNRQTRPIFLRDTAQAFIHQDVRYHTAYAAKRRCLRQLDGGDTESFHLIPAHCQQILDRDPRAMAKWSAPEGHLENLFVCPSASRLAYRHCRPMVAFDGTHTRCAYPGILLLATTLDGNDTVIVLAYGWVPVENCENWFNFMEMLRESIPKLERPGTVFVSDREKGLADGVPQVFPQGHAAYCTWHLGENVQKHHGKEIRKMFDKLPYATTKSKFEQRLDRIKEKSDDAAQYIRGTAHPPYYCRAFFPAKRWGHETSHQAESMNRVFKPFRMEVTLNMSRQVWDYIMRQYYEKRELGRNLNTSFPPNIMSNLKKIEEEAYQLIADPSTNVEVRITDMEGREFIVNLGSDWHCTCGDFQDKLLPCKHAWRALTKLQMRHFDFVSPYYSAEVFRQTYEPSLPALLRDGLVLNKRCGPPLKRRMAGRPSERVRMRFEDEEVCRLPRKCSVCKLRGHDRRNCPKRKAANEQGAALILEGNMIVDKDSLHSFTDSESTTDSSNDSDNNSNYSESYSEAYEVVDSQQQQPNRLLALPSQESIEMGPFSQLLANCESQATNAQRRNNLGL